MNTFLSPRRIALSFSCLALLGLSACAAKSPPTPVAHTTHTITIKYDATANPQWDYKIDPIQHNPKKARVKRHDTIQWKCDQGTWTVYFKGPTPLVDHQSGKELPYVSGAAGATAGGEVSARVHKDDEFTYGVSLLLPGAKDPVIDDPRIFIEN